LGWRVDPGGGWFERRFWRLFDEACENASNHDPTAKLTQRIDFVRKNEISAGSFSRET